MTKQTRNSLLLLLAAAIWGFAFVAQSTGGIAIGALSFNGIRFFVGAAVLTPVILFLDAKGLSKKPVTKEAKRLQLLAGAACGLALCFATNLQQYGINLGAGAGKSGFLTTTYVLMVPILGLFFKRKCGLHIWAGVLIALVGLYLLCTGEGFQFSLEDTLLLISAFVYAIQIMLVDYYAPKVDGVRLACHQFLWVGIFSLVPMMITEVGFTAQSVECWLSGFASVSVWVSILYAGVLSCGIAYTLQIVGQQDVNPTIASLLMSFESVFSVLGGWLFLQERLTEQQLTGCGLIFLAVVLAQVKWERGKKTK